MKLGKMPLNKTMCNTSKRMTGQRTKKETAKNIQNTHSAKTTTAVRTIQQ